LIDYNTAFHFPLSSYLGPFQHLAFIRLDLSRVTPAFLRDVARIDLKLIEFKIELHQFEYPFHPSDSEGTVGAFSNWLGKQETLRALHIGVFAVDPNFRMLFPPVMNIRKLEAYCFFDSPLLATQVPNLEVATIGNYASLGNQFAVGSVFPNMKILKINVANARIAKEFSFPNLQSLQMTGIGVSIIESLRRILSQFPTLAHLILEFDNDCSQKFRRDAWWDLFTGKIRPMMGRGSSLEGILTGAPPIPENHQSNADVLLLEVIPGTTNKHNESIPS